MQVPFRLFHPLQMQPLLQRLLGPAHSKKSPPEEARKSDEKVSVHSLLGGVLGKTHSEKAPHSQARKNPSNVWMQLLPVQVFREVALVSTRAVASVLKRIPLCHLQRSHRRFHQRQVALPVGSSVVRSQRSRKKRVQLQTLPVEAQYWHRAASASSQGSRESRTISMHFLSGKISGELSAAEAHQLDSQLGQGSSMLCLQQAVQRPLCSQCSHQWSSRALCQKCARTWRKRTKSPEKQGAEKGDFNWARKPQNHRQEHPSCWQQKVDHVWQFVRQRNVRS